MKCRMPRRLNTAARHYTLNLTGTWNLSYANVTIDGVEYRGSTPAAPAVAAGSTVKVTTKADHDNSSTRKSCGVFVGGSRAGWSYTFTMTADVTLSYSRAEFYDSDEDEDYYGGRVDVYSGVAQE